MAHQRGGSRNIVIFYTITLQRVTSRTIRLQMNRVNTYNIYEYHRCMSGVYRVYKIRRNK